MYIAIGRLLPILEEGIPPRTKTVQRRMITMQTPVRRQGKTKRIKEKEQDDGKDYMSHVIIFKTKPIIQKKHLKNHKRTTPGIPTWSPTVVLTWPEGA